MKENFRFALEQMFLIMQQEPTLAILAGVVLTIVVIVVFHTIFGAWLRKVLKVSTNDEVKAAIMAVNSESVFYDGVSPKLMPTFEERVIKKLNNR